VSECKQGTCGTGKPEAWHFRLTVEPFFTIRVPARMDYWGLVIQ